VELLARIEVVLRRAGKSEMHLRYGDIQVDIEKHTALKRRHARGADTEGV